MRLRIFALLLVCLLGCGKTPPSKVYQIGVDPSFFPLVLKEQEVYVIAFTNDLLHEISVDQHVEFQKIPMSWDNLVDGLYRGNYQAILSSAVPNLINSARYSFSEPILKTGVVLVVPLQEKKISLAALSNQLVAMGRDPEEIDLMKNYPDVDFTFYTTPVKALEGVATGKFAGALIPTLTAHAYVKDLFQNELMIASDVLTPQALRLVTLKNEATPLITLFNQGLLDLQKTGAYPALLSKWALPQ